MKTVPANFESWMGEMLRGVRCDLVDTWEHGRFEKLAGGDPRSARRETITCK